MCFARSLNKIPEGETFRDNKSTIMLNVGQIITEDQLQREPYQHR